MATEVRSAPAAVVQPGALFRAAAEGAAYRQRFVHSEARLEFLDVGEYTLPAGTRSARAALPDREGILYQWKGRSTVTIDGAALELDPYDTLYVPLGFGFEIANPYDESASLFLTTAPASHIHPVFHSKFAEISRREERIRRLPGGRDVYLMFDVSEAADKLVAGYTFFQPFARSWPPHNHTDQEEAYIFIKGEGGMEVYESPEKLTFVRTVKEGDIVAIPYLNYHPVFSQETPLEFIWCIAGERYWVGDKNKAFLDGAVDSITT